MEHARLARCAVCSQEVELTLDLLKQGCPHCGSRKFVQPRKEPLAVKRAPDPNAVISEIDKGTLLIDIDRLFKVIQEKDPLVMQKRTGEFRIVTKSL